MYLPVAAKQEKQESCKCSEENKAPHVSGCFCPAAVLAGVVIVLPLVVWIEMVHHELIVLFVLRYMFVCNIARFIYSFLPLPCGWFSWVHFKAVA